VDQVLKIKNRCMAVLSRIPTSNLCSLSYWESLFVKNRINSSLPWKQQKCVLCETKITKKTHICSNTGLVVCRRCVKRKFRPRSALLDWFRMKDTKNISMYLRRGRVCFFAPCDVALLKPRKYNLKAWHSPRNLEVSNNHLYLKKMADYSRILGGVLQYQPAMGIGVGLGRWMLAKDYTHLQHDLAQSVGNDTSTMEQVRIQLIYVLFRQYYLQTSLYGSGMFTQVRNGHGNDFGYFEIFQLMNPITCERNQLILTPGWCLSECSES
jgi:hypothetical protein